MKKKFSLLLIMMAVLTVIFINPVKSNAQTKLLIRCDDIGMCHSVNVAVKKLIATGIPFSTSVMFACPWYQEAVEILKANPQISVGVHLTLNSEWKNYKWGPVSRSVPSLTDSNGYFYSSNDEFVKCGYKLDEVETELRAQVERAVHSGVHIDYLDTHILIGSIPGIIAIVEKLAKEYHLGISGYFNEHYETLWDTDPEYKFKHLMGIVDSLRNNQPNLLVIHLGQDTREMEALIDLNYQPDPYRVSKHRQAEFDALSSPAFREIIQKLNIKLTTYKELISKEGLKNMKLQGEIF